MIHPECGCASHAVWMASSGMLPADRTHVLSTSGMLRRAAATDARRVIVATETGLIHRLRVAQPEREFIAANEAAICRYMKMITPDKLLDSLRLNIHEVTVDRDVADRARLAIERMIAIG
jgi:quinolinate synthase